jgi:hypothetical protein
VKNKNVRNQFSPKGDGRTNGRGRQYSTISFSKSEGNGEEKEEDNKWCNWER